MRFSVCSCCSQRWKMLCVHATDLIRALQRVGDGRIEPNSKSSTNTSLLFHSYFLLFSHSKTTQNTEHRAKHIDSKWLKRWSEMANVWEPLCSYLILNIHFWNSERKGWIRTRKYPSFHELCVYGWLYYIGVAFMVVCVGFGFHFHIFFLFNFSPVECVEFEFSYSSRNRKALKACTIVVVCMQLPSASFLKLVFPPQYFCPV